MNGGRVVPQRALPSASGLAPNQTVVILVFESLLLETHRRCVLSLKGCCGVLSRLCRRSAKENVARSSVSPTLRACNSSELTLASASALAAANASGSSVIVDVVSASREPVY